MERLTLDPILSTRSINNVEVGVNWFKKLAYDIKRGDDANQLKMQEKYKYAVPNGAMTIYTTCRSAPVGTTETKKH